MQVNAQPQQVGGQICYPNDLRYPAQCFMNPDVRMRFHMDIKSICGGTIDLWKAWSRTYELDSGPTDIIISLGLNDRC